MPLLRVCRLRRLSRGHNRRKASVTATAAAAAATKVAAHHYTPYALSLEPLRQRHHLLSQAERLLARVVQL